MKTQTSDLWIHKGSRISLADQQHTSSASFCFSCSFLTAAKVASRDFWMVSPILAMVGRSMVALFLILVTLSAIRAEASSISCKEDKH